MTRNNDLQNLLAQGNVPQGDPTTQPIPLQSMGRKVCSLTSLLYLRDVPEETSCKAP